MGPEEQDLLHCSRSECQEKDWQRYNDKASSWLMAVMATIQKLQRTRCDNCFLLAPLNEVHRSKCLTKNYCSQVCRDADDAVHKVCCNPDKGQRRIEERKVKTGGKDKVEAANARVDSFDKSMSSALARYPEVAEEVKGKMKKKTPREKLAKKKKKETQIDEVD